MICQLEETISGERFLAHLLDHNVKALSIGKHLIRFVFHLEVDNWQLDELLNAVRSFQ